jgi:E3 ubiquitin-protein ligase RHA2
MRSEILAVVIVTPTIVLIIVLALVLLHNRAPPYSSSSSSSAYPSPITHSAPLATKSARTRTRLAVLDSRLKTERYRDWAVARRRKCDGVGEKAKAKPKPKPGEAGDGYADADADEDEDEKEGAPQLCTICLEIFTPDARIRALDCAHVFHAECLNEWYARCKEWCPLCHRAIVPVVVVRSLRILTRLLRGKDRDLT